MSKKVNTSEWPAVLPVALKLAGQRCLLVGGGPVATRKARDVLAADGVVHVVAPQVTNELRGLANQNSFVTWSARPFAPNDLDDVRLVFTATGDVEVDENVYREAEQRGIWVNSADDPSHCSFYLTALVRRDPVVVAITTAGASPALASYLRRRLDHLLEAELAPLADLLSHVRGELHQRGLATEHLPWSSVVDDELVAAAVRGEWDHVGGRVRTAMGLLA